MRPPALPTLALLVVASCLAGCPDGPPRATGPGERDRAGAETAGRPELRLLLLSDPAGVLEPCGCTSRPLGGVDRLVASARRLAGEGVPTVLLVAGDAFTGAPEEKGPPPPGADAEAHARQVARWRREVFAEALARTGLLAATWGPADLALPEPERAALAERSGGRWFEARGVHGALLAAGGRKLGLVVVGPDGTLEAARRQAAKLRSEGARLVVALAVARRPALARRLAGLPEVDVALFGGAHRPRPLPPDEVGGGLFVHAGRHLQGLAVVDLVGIERDGAWVARGPWRRRLERERLETRIEDLTGRIEQWEREGRPPEQLAPQRQRLEALRAELAKLDEEGPAPPRYASVRWVELGPEAGGDPETRRSLDDLARRIDEANRQAYADWRPAPAPPGAPRYVGAARCGSCHEAAHAWWRGTPHGRAYATLEQRHKAFHLECVGCHVTGYGEPGGSTVTHVEGLQNVGCEVCHGPGSAHAARPETPPVRGRQVPESVCVRCHNEEHSDRFDYRSYLARLRAPGHGLPAPDQGVEAPKAGQAGPEQVH